jgi:hypothetical protein
VLLQWALLLDLLPLGLPNNPTPQKKLIRTSHWQRSVDLEAFLEPQLQMAFLIRRLVDEVDRAIALLRQTNLGRED